MEVYSPSDDSFLLVECIKKEKLTGKTCLDMGCGSGVESEAMLLSGAKNVLAVDINLNAVKATKKRIKTQLSGQSKLKVCGSHKASALHGHFLKLFKCKKSNLFSNVKEKFDIIAFNPPYVPSDSIKWVDLDGGKNGREVIDVFIPQARKHLNKKGVLLLLITSLNKPTSVKKLLKENGFSVKIVGRKKLFFECLLVLKCTRV